MWYNSIVAALLRSPLHGLVSQYTLLLTFTGRNSGKSYTIPVNYLRQGETLSVFTWRRRSWWKNFRKPAPVTVRLQGRSLPGQAALASPSAEQLERVMRAAYPRLSVERIKEMAVDMLMVEILLTGD